MISSCQVGHLSRNGGIDIVQAENGRVGGKFGCAEGMFPGADNHSQDCDDKEASSPWCLTPRGGHDSRGFQARSQQLALLVVIYSAVIYSA